MKRSSSTTLFCFSPPVMLATMIIELALAAYALWRYRADTLVRIFVAMFVFLAIFQWAEYNICEGAWGLSSLDWARVGFASITILPALGLHAILVIAGVRKRHWIYAVYAVAAIFMAFFLFVDRGMGSQVCQGNYVIFDIMPAPYSAIRCIIMGLRLSLALWRFTLPGEYASERPKLLSTVWLLRTWCS